MVFVFLYLVIVWSMLDCEQAVEVELGINKMVFGVAAFRKLSWAAILLMTIRLLGFGWGLLASAIIVFLFPTSFGAMLSLVFFGQLKSSISGFYVIHFFAMLVFGIVSLFTIEFKALLFYLKDTNYVLIYIVAAVGVTLYIVRKAMNSSMK